MNTPVLRLFVVPLLTLLAASSLSQGAVLIVSNTQDSGNGSLRDTVAATSAGDMIQFNIPTSDPGYDPETGIFTITLTSGEIVIQSDLAMASVSRAKIALSGNHSSRIFNIMSGTVLIFDLSFVAGMAKGTDGAGNGADGGPGIGGAILNQGMLTLTRCLFTGNSAIGGTGGPGKFGPGANGGDATGGAIANQGTLVVDACTLAGNDAKGGAPGLGEKGGFFISGLPGVAYGGALYNSTSGTMSLTNCTISGNRALGTDPVQGSPPFFYPGSQAHGGGIANLGVLTIVHSTLANNISTAGAPRGASFGGGLDGADGSSSSTHDSIFAENSFGVPPGAATGPDAHGVLVSQGHNLFGRSDGCSGFSPSDLLGGTTNETRLDPKLGPLGDYGGPTQTLALLAGSPAIDQGDPNGDGRDQRYFFRTGVPEIGAFEYQGKEPVRLANISTRLRVGTGDDAMIGGFVVTGSVAKAVVVRGIGPSLQVPGVIADPTIELHGPSGEVVATNDNWQDTTNEGWVIGSSLSPTNDLESALYMMLDPGAYTVVMRGSNDAVGVGLFEVYDADATSDAKLVNVSTRGFVETGDQVLIGGTVIAGSSPRVLFRGLGPSLTGSGVSNALQDPTMELYDSNGVLIAMNDNWRDTQEAEIIATGLPPSNDLESAIVLNLAAGAYTAIVRGKDDIVGVALVEAYDLN